MTSRIAELPAIRFEHQLQQESTKMRIEELSSQFKGLKVIVGVDRLDYIKGVPKKFEAFELFLERHPEWREKVVLVQVAVPSRQDVEEYATLQSKVNELVGRVNGKFGTVTYQPIHFMHRSVEFAELVSLYAVSDVCLITSTRDGLNLVSFEYVASQVAKAGVLILSEFTGAAQSLNGAIIVNPWSTKDLSEAIKEALEVPDYERRVRHRQMLRYVNKYTAAFWGTSFINELKRIAAEYSTVVNSQRLNIREVASRFIFSANARVIFLEMDLILGAPSAQTLSALSDSTRPSVKTLKLLERLSGRPTTGVGLVAEHGCFYRHPAEFSSVIKSVDDQQMDAHAKVIPSIANSGESEWITLAEHVDLHWHDDVRPVFDAYAERTPGAFVEDKEIDMAFVYGRADPTLGSWQAGELLSHMEKALSSLPLTIYTGNRRIEIHPSAVDKGSAARSILKDLYQFLSSLDGVAKPTTNVQKPPVFDFILCGGGGGDDYDRCVDLVGGQLVVFKSDSVPLSTYDRTDEPIFAFLRDPASSLPAIVQTGASVDIPPSPTRIPRTKLAEGEVSALKRSTSHKQIKNNQRPIWDPDRSKCFTVRAGSTKRSTDAHFYVKSARDVEVLLESLSGAFETFRRLTVPEMPASMIRRATS
ncbi:Trehalose-6-P synthase/phosphatase complex synthase subunit [Gonapodya sp. JEL0774]|nr:Trehalose-6-P synthase/phosphatase complex synthase subunit [Gonapodya sp. JEL0774]